MNNAYLNNINDIIKLIYNSDQIINSINNNLRPKSSDIKSIYKYFKQIVNKVSSDPKFVHQINIISNTMNEIINIDSEYERLRIYQLGMYEMFLTLNDKVISDVSIKPYIEALDASIRRLLSKGFSIQMGGGSFSEKFQQINSRLSSKLQLMMTLSNQINVLVDNIMGVIGDVNSNEGLLNIRLRIEWIIKNFNQYFADNKEAKNLLDMLEGSLTEIDGNISKSNVSVQKLEKIKTDLSSFKDAVITETNKIETTQQEEMLKATAEFKDRQLKQVQQTGGSADKTKSKSRPTNIFEAVSYNQTQTGGYFGHLYTPDQRKTYNNYSTLKDWIEFYVGQNKWKEEYRLILARIRSDFYSIMETSNAILKKYSNIKIDPDFNGPNYYPYTRPFYEFTNIFKANLNLFRLHDSNMSEIFKADYDLNSTAEKSAELETERKLDQIFDIRKYLLCTLVRNYNDTVNPSFLNDDYTAWKNININLMELYMALPYIDQIMLSISDENMLLSELNSVLSLRALEIKSLAYQTNLALEPSEYIKLKNSILIDAFKTNYEKVIQTYVSISSSLDADLQEKIKKLEIFYHNYILGISYANAYSQPHANYFDVDLNYNQTGGDNDTKINTDSDNKHFADLCLLRNALYSDNKISRIFNNICKIIIDNKLHLRTKLSESVIKTIETYSKNYSIAEQGGGYIKDSLEHKYTNIKKTNLDDYKTELPITLLVKDYNTYSVSVGDELQNGYSAKIRDIKDKLGDYADGLNTSLIEKIQSNSDVYTTEAKIYLDSLKYVEAPSLTIILEAQIKFIINLYINDGNVIKINSSDSKNSADSETSTNTTDSNTSSGTDTSDASNASNASAISAPSSDYSKTKINTYTNNIIMLIGLISNSLGLNKLIDTRDTIFLNLTVFITVQMTKIKNEIKTTDSKLIGLVDEINTKYIECDIKFNNYIQAKNANPPDLTLIQTLKAGLDNDIDAYKQLLKNFNLAIDKKNAYNVCLTFLANILKSLYEKKAILKEKKLIYELQQQIINLFSSGSESAPAPANIKAGLLKMVQYKDILENYDLIKRTNLAIVSKFDRILTESTNAIKVYVKAREEKNYKAYPNYKQAETCISVPASSGPGKQVPNQTFGKFERVYWTSTTISDLYCGEGVDCSLKTPLTRSIRDTVSGGFQANIYYTYGFSGSGKTTLLLGKKGGNPDDSVGIISRIIGDMFDSTYIPTNGTKLQVEYMIGEIYGEKTTLSLSDNSFSECLYLWNISNPANPIEDQYVLDYETLIGFNKGSNGNQVSDPEQNPTQTLSTIEILEEINKGIYNETDPEYKFKIPNFDRARYMCRSGLFNIDDYGATPQADLLKYMHMEKFDQKDDDFKRTFGIRDYIKQPVKLDSQQQKSSPQQSPPQQSQQQSPTLYQYLMNLTHSGSESGSKSESYYKKFKRGVKSKSEIIDFGRDLSDQLNKTIDNIQAIRRKRNRVRCTKYNPDSSRSHMFFIIKIKKDLEEKYYIFIDKAGSEIPYEIASNEFVKLAQLPKPEQNIFKIGGINVAAISFKKKTGLEVINTELTNKLLNALNNQVFDKKQVYEPGQLLTESIIQNITIEPSKPNTIVVKFSETDYVDIKFDIKNLVETDKKTTVDVGSDTFKSEGSEYSYQIDKANIIFTICPVFDNTAETPSFAKDDTDKANPNKHKEYNLEIVNGELTFAFNLNHLLEAFKMSDPMKEHPIAKRLKESFAKAKIKKNMPNLMYEKIDNGLDDESTSNQSGLKPQKSEFQKAKDSFQDFSNGVSNQRKLLKGLQYKESKLKSNENIKDNATEFIVNLTKIVNSFNINFRESKLEYKFNNMKNILDIELLENLKEFLFHFKFVFQTDQKTNGFLSSLFKPKKTIYFQIKNKHDSNINTLLINVQKLMNDLKGKITEQIYLPYATEIKMICSQFDQLMKSYNKTQTASSSSSNILKDFFEAFKDNEDYRDKMMRGDPKADPKRDKHTKKGVLKCLREMLEIIELKLAHDKLKSLVSEPNGEITTLITAYNSEIEKYISNQQHNFNDLSIDEARKVQIQTETNKHIFDQRKKLILDIIDKILLVSLNPSIISAFSLTNITLQELGLDYRKLLASYFIQRAYYSNIKQSSTIGCNDANILIALEQIQQTLLFLFDSSDKNILTRSLLDKNFNTSFTNPLSTNQTNITEELKFITGYINFITKTKTKPNTVDLLNVIPELFKTLDFDPEVLHGLNYDASIKLGLDTSNPTNLILEINPEISNPTHQTHIKNLIKRLIIISKLSYDLAFLDIENNAQKKYKYIISKFDDNALLDQYNRILWRDIDRITYTKDLETKFNMKLMFGLQRKIGSGSGDQTIKDKITKLGISKQIWVSEPESLWSDLANKLIPMYLLNVRQGFWINHSIRQLMLTTMYSTDPEWIGHNNTSGADKKNMFEFESKPLGKIKTESTAKSFVGEVKKGKGTNVYGGESNPVHPKYSTAEKLLDNIILLLPPGESTTGSTDAESDEVQTANKIFRNELTLEEYYLCPYNIQNSLWLKLLIGIQHMGSNKTLIDLSQSDSKDSKKNNEAPQSQPTINNQNLPLIIQSDQADTDNPSAIRKLETEIEAYAKQQKNTSDAKIKLSKSLTLLLALSTRSDKYDGVRKTLEFADLITQISNQSCGAKQDTQIGGTKTKSKYKLIKK